MFYKASTTRAESRLGDDLNDGEASSDHRRLGQDGADLAQLLVSKGDEVTGVIRRSSHSGVAEHRLSWIGVRDQIRLVDGDLLDLSSLCRIVAECQPDEVYNLGAQSFVTTSWQQPILTANATAIAVTNMLEAIRLVRHGVPRGKPA